MAANDLHIEQRDSADSWNLLLDVPYPSSVGLLVLNPATHVPVTASFGTGLSYNSSTATLNVVLSRSFGNTSRSLNTAFQISSTRDALVSYSVDIATSVSLAGGQVGTVYLEYADDSGFTTNVTEVGRFVNGNTGTLVVGLTLNQTNTAPIGGVIPAGKYVRIRTQNNTGSPTFTYRSSQEVLL